MSDDELMRERARYEALAALVDNYRRERDSYQRQVARLEEAIVTSLGQRLEPCMSRHPVTVVMAAGSLFFKIGEAIGCEFTDGDDLLEAVKGLVRERDEARAEVEHAYREGGALYEAKIAEREAFRCGAEAMREACQQWCRAWENNGDAIADALADLRVEEP